MVGFKLDEKGDVVIENNAITTVSDKELVSQTVRQVLKTNIGEWWLNENEGIDFKSIFCKNPNYEQIEDNIKNGLLQIDETFELLTFECSTKNRKLIINFTARNENGMEIEVTI